MERKDVEQLADLAGQIPDRVRSRYALIEQWRDELEGLKNKRCNGRVTWRGKNGDGASSPKMVITHKVGESCAVHGEPGDNGRLRCYIGVEKEAQREAREAIQLERRGKELEGKIWNMEYKLRNCGWELEKFYRGLDFRVRDGELVDTEEE